MASTTREIVAQAIMSQFEDDYRKHGWNYDPDQIWMAADRVVAALASQSLGVEIVAKHHPSIIGPAEFVMTGDQSVL